MTSSCNARREAGCYLRGSLVACWYQAAFVDRTRCATEYINTVTS